MIIRWTVKSGWRPFIPLYISLVRLVIRTVGRVVGRLFPECRMFLPIRSRTFYTFLAAIALPFNKTPMDGPDLTAAERAIVERYNGARP